MPRSRTITPPTKGDTNGAVLSFTPSPLECSWQGHRDYSGIAARRCRLLSRRIRYNCHRTRFKTRVHHQHKEGNPVMGPIPRSRPHQSHRWAYLATSSVVAR
jgi:hypothetical protein